MNKSPKPKRVSKHLHSRQSIHHLENSDDDVIESDEEQNEDNNLEDDMHERYQWRSPKQTCSSPEEQKRKKWSPPLNNTYSSADNSDNDQNEYEDISRHSNLSNSQHNLTNTSQYDSKSKNEKQKNSKFFIIPGVLGILATFLVTYSNTTSERIGIEYLEKNFPQQPRESLENIETIIDDVLKLDPIHPAVFLFLFSDDNDYHNNFINSVAKFASNKLGVTESHIVLDERDYRNPECQRDYGYLIHKYKPDLEKRKVMVVKNLQEMSGKTAQALHSICDEITPLVDRAVYILTLKVNHVRGSEMRVAENHLNKLWRDLDNDILTPLITRVTSTVIKIH